ncbi:hypothetical protein JCM19376_40840 [Fusibacter bizertensis]
MQETLAQIVIKRVCTVILEIILCAPIERIKGNINFDGRVVVKENSYGSISFKYIKEENTNNGTPFLKVINFGFRTSGINKSIAKLHNSVFVNIIDTDISNGLPIFSDLE